jgi:ABC-type multidrug transport system fused ATPase/permease subunit
MNQREIRKTYADLKQKNEILLARLKKQHLIISLFRLFVFIAGVTVSGFAFSHSVPAGIICLLITIIIFLYLVKKYEDFAGRITIADNLFRINCNEINALDGDYSAFDGGSDLYNAKHDFSGDIDLFGEDSLFRFLNRTVTDSGRSQLAGWLSEPYDLRGEITERQEAVIELAGKLAWRQQFMAFGFDKPLNDKEIKSLREWLNESDDSYSSLLMRIASYVLPLTTIITLLLVIAGLLPFMIFLLLYVFNLFLIGLFLKKSNRIHAMISRKQLFLSSFEQLVGSFEKEQFKSDVMSAIKEKLCAGQGSVAFKIKELNNIISAFDNRLNLFVGLILNGFLLWDFHCIMKLEKWRRSAASSLPVWLNLLGKADGLNSLANYSFNNPDNSFPEVVKNGPVLEALSMGHPLLKKEIRISNDFSVLQRGQVIIITGANMAGKSTFLRTVAVNMVLGMTGAPVCAEKMKLTPLKLFTSMRTVDSLSHNESYFYAELKRLKTLKERLEKGEDNFFILDEILKGTNSTDKSLGSKQFLRRVIDLGGTGLIATHDISLGEMEVEYPGNFVNKCFEIEIDGENISFDYLLRDGITRKMNAAALMRQMGIA